MTALPTVLLALLLCGRPGRAQDKEEEDDDTDFGLDGYDDDDDEEEEEAASVNTGGRGQALLRCYSCQSLHSGESCGRIQNCVRSHSFCKAVISHGNTESGPLTTYSAWCTDACKPINKTLDGTLMILTCCQSALCNLPPWQDPLGRGAGSPQGDAPTVATALLLSLLPGLQAVGY